MLSQLSTIRSCTYFGKVGRLASYCLRDSIGLGERGACNNSLSEWCQQAVFDESGMFQDRCLAQAESYCSVVDTAKCGFEKFHRDVHVNLRLNSIRAI